jgi:ligand-binding sensor domain-containing protein
MIDVPQRLAVWLFVLAAPSAVVAADGAASTEPEFASRTYRAEEGLSSNLVYALAQDRDGYLWVGGSGGLSRFDGAQFVAWGAHGEPPLPYGEVRSLFADRDGSLWIGFNEPSVVSRIRGNRLDTFRSGDGLPGGIIQPSAQDRSGAVWAVGPGGTAVFAAGRWTHRHGRAAVCRRRRCP